MQQIERQRRFLTMRIIELELMVRTEKALLRYTGNPGAEVSVIARLSEKDLKRQGMGRRSIDELKEQFALVGLNLGMSGEEMNEINNHPRPKVSLKDWQYIRDFIKKAGRPVTVEEVIHVLEERC